MRFYFLFLLFLTVSFSVTAQKNYLSGNWLTYSTPYHTDSPTGKIFVNTVGTARWDHSGPYFLNRLEQNNSGCTYDEESLNNYSSFTLSLVTECASSDTLNTFNLTAIGIGSPFYMFGYSTHVKSLKNNSDIDLNCFYNKKCYGNRFESYLRKESERTVKEDDIFVGSSSYDYIKIEEIRFTKTSTEVLLLFKKRSQDYGGTLHFPGADFAYFLRDLRGNRYDLISQFGWDGPDKGNYGSTQIPKDTEKHVILFFDPVDSPSSVNNLSLIEGQCENNCWNFYDIRLKD